MQSTESLILEYGRARHNTTSAIRHRQRIRKRRQRGDRLAVAFWVALESGAFRAGEPQDIDRQLRRWLSDYRDTTQERTP